jgi:hypothetical protein
MIKFHLSLPTLHRYMDDGGIPDAYTSETFKAALADNQVTVINTMHTCTG